MSDPFAKVQAAAAFAARAHHGQMVKDGRTPYVSHVYRVCLVVRHVFSFDDPEMLMAALLHDTIEDTTTDFDDIAAQFGPRVAEWVRALTKDKRLPELEREETYARGLVSGGWPVQVLKLADIYDNLSDVAQLPTERRPHTLARARFYLEHLAKGLDPKAKGALELVEGLLQNTG